MARYPQLDSGWPAWTCALCVRRWWYGNRIATAFNLSDYGNYGGDMSTTSGGDPTTAGTPVQDNSVTTVYNDGDRTAVSHRASTPPSSSYADSGLDTSNTESTAGDAKLIIDVPDFSRGERKRYNDIINYWPPYMYCCTRTRLEAFSGHFIGTEGNM